MQIKIENINGSEIHIKSPTLTLELDEGLGGILWSFKIEDIRDTSPQSLNKLNSTIRAIVSKIYWWFRFY